MDKQLDEDKITRLEVIGPSGRELLRQGVSVKVSVQDGDRTLKVFLAYPGLFRDGGDGVCLCGSLPESHRCPPEVSSIPGTPFPGADG